MNGRTIVLGATVGKSLGLMDGYPEYLVGRGWSVTIVCSPGPELKRMERTGVNTHAIEMSRNPSPAKDLIALWHWIALFRKLKPDVICVGTPKAGLLSAFAGFATKVPARVYLLRGLRLETTSGIRRLLLASLERVVMKCTHITLAVGPSLRTLAIKLRLVNPDRIVVVGNGSSNGVNIQRFNPARLDGAARASLRSRLNLVPHVPVIGFVGRLTEEKGLKLLLDSRRILVEKGIDHQLLIVGEIDDNSEAVSTIKAVRLGRPAVWTGQVDDTSLYFPLMDLHCSPSLREGFPNVVLEASATGVPTVATAATGNVDAVVDGKTGFVVPVNSSVKFAEALAELLRSSELRRHMGEAARRYACENYEQMTVWQGNEALVSSVYNEQSRKRKE